MNKRELLKLIGLTVGAVALGSTTAVMPAEKQYLKRRRVLRIAHITDVHISPQQNTPDRFRKCLEAVKANKIDFFLNGGDSIMAADYKQVTRENMNEQWNLWHETTQSIAGYEMYSCLGNHDMWWAAPDKLDAMYGKDYAVKQLKMPYRYYSFDKKGWHFLILDSNNNEGSLDDEQRRWLEKDLQSVTDGTPVICLSHYPILAVCTHIEGGGNHTDSKYISNLFYKHKDKKFHCFSGHMHLLDHAVYNEVNYFCNGAMSGAWWGVGDATSAEKYFRNQTPPGYAILDLFDDGTLSNKYIPHLF